MAEYKITLIKREEVAEGTMAFCFEKPAGFNFIAGQHAVFALINPPETDHEGNRRVFCFTSAPYEKRLIIAMRMRDTAFKRVLKSMPLGNEVEMIGPYGSFILYKDGSRPAVFLAGGIGITPVRSILFQAEHEGSARVFYLFYSNHRREDAAFFDVLTNLKLRNYTCIPVMSDTEGYIDKSKLAAHLDDFSRSIFYAVGPPGFVLAMRGMLNVTGVDSAHIRTDQFSGY